MSECLGSFGLYVGDGPSAQKKIQFIPFDFRFTNMLLTYLVVLVGQGEMGRVVRVGLVHRVHHGQVGRVVLVGLGGLVQVGREVRVGLVHKHSS